MKWERLFSTQVLERGLKYWSDGAIRQIVGNNGSYSAVVSGGDDYEVTITKNSQGDVEDMNCDCPHAEDGNNCKHMAAVLYALDEATRIEQIARIESDKDAVGAKAVNRGKGGRALTIKGIINSLTIEELRDELLREADKDTVLASRLKAMYQSKGALERTAAGKMGDNTPGDNDWSEFVRVMRRRINGIIRDRTDRSGFVDWRNSRKLIQDLEHEVLGELSDIVEYGKEALVVHGVASYLYEQFASIALDGSGGEYQDFAGSMMDLWEEVHDVADEEQRATIFSDMLDLYERIKARDDYLAEELFDFMLDHFDAELLNRRKLAAVDTELEQLKAARLAEAEKMKGRRRAAHTASVFGLPDSYEFERLVLQRIGLMEQLGYEQSDILDFRAAYRELPRIRKLEMDELEEQGDLSALIALLEESKELDKGRGGLIAHYSDRLVSCYDKQGNKGRARDEAYAYVMLYQPGSLEGFIRLKSYVDTHEWKSVRENVFEVAGPSRNLNALYHEEGLYDRILASLQRDAENERLYGNGLLSEIIRYEDVLKPLYERDLLALYERLVRTMARPTSGRAGYKEIVKVLRRMLVYEGGPDRVHKLLDEWRFTYANRPAMQEELRAVFAR
jgi:hypothetical protein